MKEKRKGRKDLSNFEVDANGELVMRDSKSQLIVTGVRGHKVPGGEIIVLIIENKMNY